MAFKHKEIEIPEKDPFKNCKLGREKYADALTQIVENHIEGFVLAINNKWGTGKTTFVKMWEQSLSNSGFKTIYFNAWENDFEDNPLTALIGELKVINKEENDAFYKVMKNAATISKNVVPAILKAFLKKHVDSDTLVDAISDTSKSVLDIFENDINEYLKRKESISEFRKSLREYVANESNGKSLIFIIDELDRCRPNYAVLLLEQVKHFFSVPNIVFVLSIDKIQLGNAVCGVYGSEKIDSEEYLRRFIDIEYSIPEPDNEKFFTYLYNYFNFDLFFNDNERVRHYEFQYEKTNFIETGKIITSELTLRQQEKMLSHTRLVLQSFKQDSYSIPSMLLLLIYIKFVDYNFYKNISKKNLSIIDLQEDYYKIIQFFINENTKRVFTQLEAFLLKSYENYKEGRTIHSELTEVNQNDGNPILKINSKIDNNMLLESFIYLYRNLHRFEISYLLNKIDLIESIKIN